LPSDTIFATDSQNKEDKKMTLQGISSANYPANAAVKNQVKTQDAPAQPATDTVALSDSDSKKEDITIKQAVTGLAGAVAGAAIEGVGNTLSSVVNLPRATYYAGKALWKTEMIGPVLKTSLAMLLPVGALAVPVLTALGSIGYGMFHGFQEGVEKGLGSAVKETAKDVKYFHKDIAQKAVDGLQQIETGHLPEGQEPYDIKVIEAGKGLVGAAAGAVVDGVGVGAVTLGNTPRGVYKAYKHILTSDEIGPVLKTTASLLVLPAAVLATPLATVGGAVYGVYKGFGDAYRDGITKSAGERFNDVKEYYKAVDKFLDKA
jgi:hypothetical protein